DGRQADATLEGARQRRLRSRGAAAGRSGPAAGGARGTERAAGPRVLRELLGPGAVAVVVEGAGPLADGTEVAGLSRMDVGVPVVAVGVVRDEAGRGR